MGNYDGESVEDVKKAVSDSFLGKRPTQKRQELQDVALLLTKCLLKMAETKPSLDATFVAKKPGSVQVVTKVSEETTTPNEDMEGNTQESQDPLFSGKPPTTLNSGWSRQSDNPPFTSTNGECLKFTKGQCKDGNKCSAGKHPTLCWKHAKTGKCDKGRDCDSGYHVFVCPSSYKRRVCLKKECKFAFHLKDTRRTEIKPKKATIANGQQVKKDDVKAHQGAVSGGKSLRGPRTGDSKIPFLGEDLGSLMSQMKEMQLVVAALAKSISPVLQNLNTQQNWKESQPPTSPWLQAVMRNL